jgi:hypothetical protein
MPPARFERAIPPTERPKAYALDRAATGIVLLGLIVSGYVSDVVCAVCVWLQQYILTPTRT